MLSKRAHKQARPTKAPQGKAPKGAKGPPKFQPTVNSQAGPSALGIRVGFPANRTVSLTYAEYVKVTSTSGAQGLVQFSLNNAFDPEAAIGGHQPMGFDQWSQFYNHYVVEACTYDVTICPIDAPVAMVYSTHISDDTVVPSTISTLLELGAAATVWYPNTAPHIFRGHVDIAKFFNRTDIAADSALRALTTAGPTEQVYLNVRTEPGDAGSTILSKALITLTYRIRFMEPKDLPPSAALMTPVKPIDDVRIADDGDDYEFVRVKKALKAAATAAT